MSQHSLKEGSHYLPVLPNEFSWHAMHFTTWEIEFFVYCFVTEIWQPTLGAGADNVFIPKSTIFHRARLVIRTTNWRTKAGYPTAGIDAVRTMFNILSASWFDCFSDVKMGPTNPRLIPKMNRKKLRYVLELQFLPGWYTKPDLSNFDQFDVRLLCTAANWQPPRCELES